MGSVTFDATSPATQGYVFNALASGSLKVTYVGPDCLTAGRCRSTWRTPATR